MMPHRKVETEPAGEKGIGVVPVVVQDVPAAILAGPDTEEANRLSTAWPLRALG
jgi:hypothetical protein